STDKFYFGWSYKRWNSFFDYKPIDYLSKIDIPILFIQGKKDFSSPVESVEFVQNNINKNNFSYKYYENMGHLPESDKGINEIMEYINNWEK
nr:alpha/beta hydrolase [Spirochaetota bacterium]